VERRKFWGKGGARRKAALNRPARTEIEKRDIKELCILDQVWGGHILQIPCVDRL